MLWCAYAKLPGVIQGTDAVSCLPDTEARVVLLRWCRGVVYATTDAVLDASIFCFVHVNL
jgi:hypothetical protein